MLTRTRGITIFIGGLLIGHASRLKLNNETVIAEETVKKEPILPPRQAIRYHGDSGTCPPKEWGQQMKKRKKRKN